MTTWGSDVEIERRNRIFISIYAYAYELKGDSLISDAEYDELSLKIRPELSTGHEILDEFFKTEFTPDSGMWIRRHPDLHSVHNAYLRFKRMMDKKESKMLITYYDVNATPTTGEIVSSDGKFVTIKILGDPNGTKLTVPVVNCKKITEEGELLPLTKKDLIKYRGECG